MNPESTNLPDFITLLRKLDPEITAQEVAEMLWLATRLPTATAQPRNQPPLSLGSPKQLDSQNPAASDARQSLPPQRSENLGTTISIDPNEQESGQSSANLYPTQAQSAKGKSGARAIRSPAAFALPDTLGIARNLRPLKRRVPSRTRTLLDEAATAHRIADSGQWQPIFTPAPERWLDVVLVVDESSSMVIWQRMIAELQQLLERQGAFRTVTLYGFRGRADQREINLYRGIGPRADRNRTHPPNELIDPLGRRLLLVVSDCVAPVWHNGVMATLLADWGQRLVVSLLQVLPDRLWVRSGLRTFPAIYLRSPAPGTPNHEFDLEWTTHRLPDRPRHSAPLPVVALDALPLGYWARVLAGNSNLWIPGVLAIPKALETSVTEATPTRPAATTNAQQLLRVFYGTASPIARRLANFLSAVPLTLPIMRLVQQSLLPESRIAHLAEVFLSGLIERPAQPDDSKAADSVEYFFVEGVREQLRNNLRLTEAINVLDVVSNYVGERTGQPLDFGALIADPSAEGEFQIDQEYQPFARVAASALRRFGGQYADLADRLESSLFGEPIAKRKTAATTQIDTRSQRQAQRKGRSDQAITIYGLLVGINQYADSAVSPLQSCLADVQRTAAWLQEQHRVTPSTMQVLTDRQATKRAILAALQSLGQQVSEGDQVYIHYSGRDQAIATDDPNEGDGLEETLFVYDSKPDERASLITHRELVDLLKKIDQRGAQVVLFLDTCRAGSGYLCRHDLGEILVIAASHEGELSYEGEIEGELNYASKIEGTRAGIASYFLAQAMINYHTGMTWAEVFDQVYVNVKNRYPDQTPQWIGPRDLLVFSNERKSTEPYLLVTKKIGFQITVSVHEALTLEIGAKLALFPAGSDLQDLPLRRATVTAIESDSVTAEVEQLYGEDLPSAPIEPGYRAKLLSFEENPYLTVAWESSLPAPTTDPIVRFAQNDEDAVYRVRSDPATATLLIEDQNEHVLWQITSDPAQNMIEQANLARTVLRSIALFHRFFVQRNQEVTASLADAIELTVIPPAGADPNTVVAEQPTTLKLYNRADVDLYISVWMLNNHLGIQRIYPPASDCLLLGKGRQLQLSLTLHLSDADKTSESITFKVFATRTPANLDVLQLPRLAQPVDLGNLEQFAEVLRQKSAPTNAPRKRPARKESPRTKQTKVEPSDEHWNPGGPVAIRSKLWRNGQTLRVRFLDGDRRLQARVRAVMLLWTEHANLHFAFGDDADAEIRISFKQEGSWSYTGTDCLTVAKTEPTTNFGWLQPSTPEDEIRRVVLREVGHALGLGLGLLSPVANLPWNREAVFREYMAPPNNWTRELVEQNFFNKYKEAEVTIAPPDAKSIMVNPIPAHLTDGKLEVGWNRELSAGDKAFIEQVYPRLMAA